jgi:hypothetical protein
MNNPLGSFDLAAMEAMMASMAEAPRGPRFQPLPTEAFPAASLTAWMNAAMEAGVPSVPAKCVAELSIDALLRSDDPREEGAQEVLDQLAAINAALPADHMLRWDCCASYALKDAMAEGQVPAPEERGIGIDIRSFDLLFEFPAETIAVLQRPWVNAQELNGFPIEFRVFVADGRVHAVANYYLQRPLPDTPAIRSAVKDAVAATEAIVAHLQSQGQTPVMPFQPEGQETSFRATLDFLVDEQGQVLFLEAGPGWGQGAHPCAFLQPDGCTVDPVEGLKLGSGQPTLAL